MIDKQYSLDFLNEGNKGNMGQAIGMEFTSIAEDHLEMRMPVDERTIQPIGILNGGASAALAETVGSMAAYLSIDRSKYYSVGLEIKCNHVRSALSGWVYGRATAIHIGRRTHVWDIKIRNEEGKLVCNSILTVQILLLDDTPGVRAMLASSPLGRLP